MKITDKENRLGRYLPDEGDEMLLRLVNAALEEKFTCDSCPERPVLFVAGSPRSGTTFMAQSVCSYFDVDYVDNLASRFWKAPYFGMRLSKMVFGENRSSSFLSEYGRTASADIHSFHYFWMERLMLEEAQDLFSDCSIRGVDWGGLRAAIAAMQSVRGKSFVFKGYYPAYFLSDFIREIPNCLFIFIERDPLEQAISIYMARLAYHGNASKWWSMQPPGVDGIAKLSPEEQVAFQICGLKAHFEEQAGKAGGDLRLVRVNYDELVRDPVGILEAVRSQIEEKIGTLISVRGMIPTVHKRRNKLPSDVTSRLEKALMRFGSVTRKGSGIRQGANST